MRVFRTVRRAAIVAAVIALPSTGVATAHIPGDVPGMDADVSPVAVFGAGSGGKQHGSPGGHLPARTENYQLVSKLELTGRFGDIVPEQLADISVHKGFAYLNSWNEPTCQRGGTYIVDIRDPRNPREIGFLPAPAGSINGEGAHVVTYNGRDIIATNNEPCTFANPPSTPPAGPGGFNLWDVTNPSAPIKFGPAGAPTGGDTGGEDSMTGTDVPHSIHSTVMWEHGGRLYLMTIDNIEGHDVDIFDISNPAAPAPVAEYDLDETFPQIVDSGDIGSFLGTFHHDSKVKIINGRAIALISYWDGGYVTVDMTNPRVPTYIGDSSFLGPDPLTGLTPPEGNAHYAEFSHDNRFILAADEDFTTHRAGSFSVEGTEYPASGVGGGAPAATLPDRVMNGPTVYGGYACPGSPPPPLRSAYNFVLDAGEEAILVLQRGPTGDTNNPEAACFPGQKAERAWDAGWRNVLFVNRHLGTAADDVQPFCGSGGYVAGKIPVSVCTTHTAAHDIFDDAPPEYGTPYDDETEMAAIGTVGDRVRATSQFDGWGYAHLYRHEAGKVTRVDSWAVEESLDERFSTGFGDLSIHEHAADPTENVSYVAYYAAGARAITFGDQGITETGAFVDQGGNNFWGVEWFNAPGDRERLAAFSDRDYGIYILRYTGPGAATAPSCNDALAFTRRNRPVTVPLTCTDPNTGNVVTRTIVSQPSNGTAELQGDRAVYTPRRGFGGEDRFTFRAGDGSLVSNVATVRILVGRCSNRLTGTAGHDVIDGTSMPDAIDAGAGNDRVAAAQGEDCVTGGPGRDSIVGAQHRDALVGGGGNDRLFGDTHRDQLDGRSGGDHLRGGSGDDRMIGGSGNDYLGGGSNDDTLIGGSGRDSIRAEAGDDRISGGSGDDTIDAGVGRSRINAGPGDDKVKAVNLKRNRIRCGSGRDSVWANTVDVVARDCEVVRVTRRVR